jgi:hypothetical protein
MHFYLLKTERDGKVALALNLDKDCFKGVNARRDAEKAADDWVKGESGRKAVVVASTRTFWSTTHVHTDAPQESHLQN